MKKIFRTLSFLIAFILLLTSCKPKVTGSFEGRAKGHNGDVVITLDIENSQIKNINLKESLETEDIGELAISKLMSKVNSNDFNLDIITGATYSSEAFISAYIDALKKSGLDYKNI